MSSRLVEAFDTSRITTVVLPKVSGMDDPVVRQRFVLLTPNEQGVWLSDLVYWQRVFSDYCVSLRVGKDGRLMFAKEKKEVGEPEPPSEDPGYWDWVIGDGKESPERQDSPPAKREKKTKKRRTMDEHLSILKRIFLVDKEVKRISFDQEEELLAWERFFQEREKEEKKEKKRGGKVTVEIPVQYEFGFVVAEKKGRGPAKKSKQIDGRKIGWTLGRMYSVGAGMRREWSCGCVEKVSRNGEVRVTAGPHEVCTRMNYYIASARRRGFEINLSEIYSQNNWAMACGEAGERDEEEL